MFENPFFFYWHIKCAVPKHFGWYYIYYRTICIIRYFTLWVHQFWWTLGGLHAYYKKFMETVLYNSSILRLNVKSVPQAIVYYLLDTVGVAVIATLPSIQTFICECKAVATYGVNIMVGVEGREERGQICWGSGVQLPHRSSGLLFSLSLSSSRLSSHLLFLPQLFSPLQVSPLPCSPTISSLLSFPQLSSTLGVTVISVPSTTEGNINRS